MTDISSAAPRFSITVPAYNATSTLAETVESVQGQTAGDWELIIVNDGSTDRTLELANQLAAEDIRIRVVSQENRGTGGAYNTAVRNARAEWIVMLAADDLLLPGHLERMGDEIAAHPEAGIVTSGGYYEYDDGTREEARSNASWADPHSCTLEELLRHCFYAIGATYRKTAWEAQDGFIERIYAEDYPFWLFTLAHGFLHRYVDEPLSVHRRNRLQKSSDSLRTRKADLAAVKRLYASGLLQGPELRAARQRIWYYRFVVAARAVLSLLLGGDRANRLIDRLKGRRPIGTQRETGV